MPRIARSRATVSSTVPWGWNSAGSCSAAWARATSASLRAFGMPSADRSAAATCAAVGKARRSDGRLRCAAGSAVPQICVSREPSLRAGLHRHLLAEDGAHRELEAVPAAGRAQAGPLRDQRRQQRILRQVRADRRDVGAEVEHAADAPDDGGQGAHRGEADGRVEAGLLRQVADLDRAGQAILQHGPAIGARPRSTRRRRWRAPFRNASIGVPVVGRAVARGAR